jgi:hypothetical protein
MEKPDYSEANAYTPVPDKKYRWVWEYSQFRFEWAFEKTRYVEEKGQKLIQLLMATSAGVWATFTFLFSRHMSFGYVGIAAISVGLLCLLRCGQLSLRVIRPNEHLYPMREHRALACVDRYPDEEMAMAKFSAALEVSTRSELQVTKAKSDALIEATAFECLGVLFVAIALASEVFR